MKHMIRLTDHTATDIMDIFHSADEIQQGKYADILKGKSIVMFFPETSIRTRVTFEKGISLLGGQPILFPPEALDKKEALQDVCGYLSLWADALIVRHKDIRLLEKLAQHSDIPVINAMTDSNHPCEIIADMYALSKRRKDFLKDSYLFCGENGNIGLAWKEASLVMGFDLSQCCPKGWEMEHIAAFDTITEAIQGKDGFPAPGCSRGLQKLPGNQGSYGNGQQRRPAQSLSSLFPGQGSLRRRPGLRILRGL